MKIQVNNTDGQQFVQTGVDGEINYYPVNLTYLELFNRVSQFYVEVNTGNLKLCAWTNPAVPSAVISKTKLFSLSYCFILYFLKLKDTRDIWKVFPDIPVKTLSYMRERASFFDQQINYKVAILTCLHKGYTQQDPEKVQRIFRECGLAGDNYVYYNLLLDSEEYKNLIIDNELILNVPMLEKEIDRFAESEQTIKLCRYHARMKLSFITKSGNFGFDELATELQINTMVVYRLCRPMLSIAYSENYARRAMTNTVQRVIFSQTKHEDKINMWKTNKGFTMRFNRMDDPSNRYDPTEDCIIESVGFTEDMMLDRITARKKFDEEIVAAVA